METNSSLAGGHTSRSSHFSRFLWWLATAEKELIESCVVDRNRYRIIGFTVMVTWLFATASWIYFFSTISSSPTLFILAGIFMGFVILCIDRALIKGINQLNKKRFIPLAFRAILALTIGTFMAQPVVLFMFKKEIDMQVSLDNEKRKQNKRSELDKLYSGRKSELQGLRTEYLQQLAQLDSAVAASRAAYLSESDGSGGTGKVGIAAIAKAKKAEYEKLESNLAALKQSLAPQQARVEAELREIETKITAEQTVFDGRLKDGFLIRVEAMNNLMKQNLPLQWRYYLIVAILMLIELMPVIAKSMLPNGSYDEKVRLREKLEKDLAFSNIEKEKQLKEWYNSQVFEQNREMINKFFAQQQEDSRARIAELSRRWSTGQDTGIDPVWEKIKKDILLKLEN